MSAPADKPPLPRIQKVMVGLCLALIVLQAADGLSTHLALSTGLAQENNELLIALSKALGWPIMQTVMAAKILVGGFFGISIIKTSATPFGVGILAVLAVYFGYIVGMNFYLAWVLN